MKVLLVVLIILVLFILIKVPGTSKFSKSSKFSEDLYNGEHWNNYRIGDVFLMSPQDGRFYNPKYSENILYHTKDYPDSIAAEYMNKNKKYQNFDLLNQIINKRKKENNKLDDHTLVLHIRVGDVLCKKVWIENAPEIYSKVGNIPWWDGVIQYIIKNNITKVIIIAGTHFKDCLEESYDYIVDRTNFLVSNGLNVEYRLGQSPDDDIIFCQGAKHFITTGGGYGKLLNMIVNKNKGK